MESVYALKDKTTPCWLGDTDVYFCQSPLNGLAKITVRFITQCMNIDFELLMDILNCLQNEVS